MKSKWILVLFMLLVSLSSVLAAANMGDVVKKIGDLRIHTSIVEYPEVWDAICVFIVFIILGTVFLSKPLGTAGRGGTIGFVLGAITYSGFRIMGFSLMKDLGPWFAAVSLVVLGFVLVKFLKGKGEGKGAAALGTFLVLTILGTFQFMDRIIASNEWLATGWTITWFIALIYTIITLFEFFKGKGSSATITTTTPPTTPAGTGAPVATGSATADIRQLAAKINDYSVQVRALEGLLTGLPGIRTPVNVTAFMRLWRRNAAMGTHVPHIVGYITDASAIAGQIPVLHANLFLHTLTPRERSDIAGHMRNFTSWQMKFARLMV